jgi:hypothetical protein
VTEEELAALEERLAEAEAEVERLQTTAADREARAAHLEDLSAGSRGNHTEGEDDEAVRAGGKAAALPRVLQGLRERGPPPDDGGLSLALPASNVEALR